MTTLKHVCVRVLDLDRSVAFYQEALGLTPQREVTMADPGLARFSWVTAPRNFSWSCARSSAAPSPTSWETTPPMWPWSPRILRG